MNDITVIFFLYILICCMGYPDGSVVKNLPADAGYRRQERRIWSLGREDPPEEKMATHTSVLAWKIPWTEEPSRLQSMGSQSRTQLSTHTHTHTHTHTQYVVHYNSIFPFCLLHALISVHDLTVFWVVSARCHLFSIVNLKEQRGAHLCTALYGVQHSTVQRSVWAGCSLMTVSRRFWSPSSLFYWTVH